NVDTAFLVAKGIPMALLGLAFLWAYMGLVGTNSDRGYLAGLAIGGVGLAVFLVALGRSIFTSHYLIPNGLFLMGLGLVYVLLSAGICLDSKLVVLTRRELSAFFFSPTAYIVFFGLAILGWYRFWDFASLVWVASEPVNPMSP